MGRGPTGNIGQTVSTWMEPELLRRLDYIAKRVGVTRSLLIKRVLRIASYRVEQAVRLGVAKPEDMLNHLDDQLEAWVEAWQDDPQAMRETLQR